MDIFPTQDPCSRVISASQANVPSSREMPFLRECMANNPNPEQKDEQARVEEAIRSQYASMRREVRAQGPDENLKAEFLCQTLADTDVGQKYLTMWSDRTDAALRGFCPDSSLSVCPMPAMCPECEPPRQPSASPDHCEPCTSGSGPSSASSCDPVTCGPRLLAGMKQYDPRESTLCDSQHGCKTLCDGSMQSQCAPACASGNLVCNDGRYVSKMCLWVAIALGLLVLILIAVIVLMAVHKHQADDAGDTIGATDADSADATDA